MKNKVRVLGIYREEIYSNRAVLADKAILDELINELVRVTDREMVVTKLRADLGLPLLSHDYDLVFSMAQGEEILSQLELFEERGVLVINPARSIRNCYRSRLSELLCDEDFSYPRNASLSVAGSNPPPFYCAHGYWVKRGDFHALVDEDVLHIDSIEDLEKVLGHFRGRGVNNVILQENCHGELFKFYGVKDQFFNLRYVGKTSKDRYSTDAGNPHIFFDRDRLEELVHRAAHILGLDYFGGDCIITETGKMHFIDFNDWPSFRTCRKEAANAMAGYALKKLKRGVLHASSAV
ncbi:MAG: hypothetical protein ACXVLQ_12615 [Bacteriovorax sp.]